MTTATAESDLVISLVHEGCGAAGEKLDEMRLVLAVLDRALDLASMVDTLEDFGVYAQATTSRMVALFEVNTPSARTVFKAWAASNDLAIDELTPNPANGRQRVLIAYRQHHRSMRRDIAALHLITEPTTEKA